MQTTAPPLIEMMIYRAVRLLHVLDRDLHLAVGAQPPDRAILAHVGELLGPGASRSGQHSLVRGVAKHAALVAGANVQVATCPCAHAARDVGRLVDAHQHLASVAREALGLDRLEIVDERVIPPQPSSFVSLPVRSTVYARGRQRQARSCAPRSRSAHSACASFARTRCNLRNKIENQILILYSPYILY